jgi:hypothetical protein
LAGYIFTAATDLSSKPKGGNISLTSRSGSIGAFGLYTSFQNGGGVKGDGGDVIINSAKDISVEIIDTYASNNGENQGVRSGSVSLKAADNVIVKRHIYTAATEQNVKTQTIPYSPTDSRTATVQNYTEHDKDAGQGGDVTIEAGGNIQLEGQFLMGERGGFDGTFYRDTDFRCQGASICTSGQGSSGKISLTYGKSLSVDPGFTVGLAIVKPEDNGSKGLLVSGSNIQAGSITQLPSVAKAKPGVIEIASKVPPIDPCLVNPSKCVALPLPPTPILPTPILPTPILPTPACVTNPEACKEVLSQVEAEPQKRQRLPGLDLPDEGRRFIDSLEERFTSEYEQFLGVKASKPMNVEQIQKRLGTINRETETENVLVYMFFRGGSVIQGKDKKIVEQPNIWEWQTCRPGSKDKKCSPTSKEYQQVILKLKGPDAKSQQLTEQEKQYLVREAGQVTEPYAEDTLGLALVTANRKILIPYVDSKTGCPIFYPDLIDLETQQFLRSQKLHGFNNTPCSSFDEFRQTDWQTIASRVVRRSDLVKSSNLRNKGMIQEFIDDLSPNNQELRSPKPSQELYKWLIQPFVNLLGKSEHSKTHISFILDPTLGIFPMAALLNAILRTV